MKNGEQHIRSLNDGRQVYLNGAVVDDVTTHPAFRNVVASVGRLSERHRFAKRCGGPAARASVGVAPRLTILGRQGLNGAA